MGWPEGLRGTERQGQDVGQWQEARDGTRVVSREGRGFRGDAGKGVTRGKRRKGRSRHQACPLRHSVLARGCSHHPSVAFLLLPIRIYLFIDFCEVFLSPSPYCPCCPDTHHPTTQLSVQLSVCLSVIREIKMASSRTCVVVYGGEVGY